MEHEYSQETKQCYKRFFLLKHSVPMLVSSNVKYNLFNACVLSILLYASQAWCPGFTHHELLEKLKNPGLIWFQDQTSFYGTYDL